MRRHRARRRLLTILFTDIVGSTDLAAGQGDRRWRLVQKRHHALVRDRLRRHGGREVDTAGDGFFATFDEPAQAIECALEIRDAVADLGIAIRGGIHTGEVELGEKPGGLAVVIGARVMATSEPGEIRVSSTVRDLVAGADLSFADSGVHVLKGVPGEWRLFAVERVEAVLPAPQPTARRDPAAWRNVHPAFVLGGLLAVAVGVGGLAVLLSANRETATTAGPNTVVRIDAESNEVTAVVGVGTGPGPVTVGAGAVWVANVQDQTISRIDPETLLETARPGGVGAPTGLLAEEESVWITDGFGGRLSVVDSRNNEVALVRDDMHGAAGIASGFNAIWITDQVGDRVFRINTRTREVEATIPLEPGSGPIAIAAGTDAIWVANEVSVTLVRIDPATNEVVGRSVALCCRPTAITVADDEVWMASAERDMLQHIDGVRQAVIATIEAGDGPSAIIADGDTVWVINARQETLWRLTREGEPVATVRLAAQPGGFAIADGSVWVTLRADPAVGYGFD